MKFVHDNSDEITWEWGHQGKPRSRQTKVQLCNLAISRSRIALVQNTSNMSRPSCNPGCVVPGHVQHVQRRIHSLPAVWDR